MISAFFLVRVQRPYAVLIQTVLAACAHIPLSVTMAGVRTLEMQLLVDPSLGEDLCQMSLEIILVSVTGELALWSMLAPVMESTCRAPARRGSR